MKCERMFFNTGKTVHQAIKDGIVFINACKGCDKCSIQRDLIESDRLY